MVSFDRGRRRSSAGWQPLFRRVYDTVAGALRYATTVWPATAIVFADFRFDRLRLCRFDDRAVSKPTGSCWQQRPCVCVSLYAASQRRGARAYRQRGVLDDKIASTAVVFIVAYFLALLAGTIP